MLDLHDNVQGKLVKRYILISDLKTSQFWGVVKRNAFERKVYHVVFSRSWQQQTLWLPLSMKASWKTCSALESPSQTIPRTDCSGLMVST